MFINIENKENSAAKMVAVAGQPTKHYLFAQELNTMVSAINSLRHLISLNEGNINSLLSTAPKIELGTIAVDFVDEINAMEEIEIPSPVFITFTKDDIFYVYAFAGEANTYGTLNGLFVSADDFLPVYQSDVPGPLSTFNYLKLLIQPADIVAWENGTGNLFLTDKRFSVYFGNGTSISITANDQNNGSLTLPRVSGMIETIRSVTNVTNNRDFFDVDTSRLIVLTGTGAKTLTLPSSLVTGQLEFQVILKQGTGFIASPTFTINGANTTIELESNVLYRLKKISGTEYVLTPKPGSGGAAVWGGITGDITTQEDLQAKFNKLENFFISKQNGTFGTHTGDLLETVLLSETITGGVFVASDWLKFLYDLNKTGSAGNLTLRVRAGLTGTTADTLIATYTSPAGNGDISLYRERMNFLTGNLLRGFRNITGSSTDNTGSVTKTTASINPANDWKLTITAQLGNAGDVVNLVGLIVSKIKSI